MVKKQIEQIIRVLMDLKGLKLLWAGLFCICVVLIVVLGVYNCIQTYRSETRNVLEQKKSLSLLVAGMVSGKLDSLVDLGISFATRPRLIDSITNGDWSGAMDVLGGVLQNFQFIDRMFLFDPDGIIRADVPAAVPSVIGQSRADKEWYKGFTRDWRPYVSGIYQRGSDPKVNIVSIAIPIRFRYSPRVDADSWTNEGSRVIGILLLQMKLNTLQEWIKEADVGPDGLVFIVDQYGHLVYHPKFKLESEIVDFSSVPIVQELMKGLSGKRINYNPVEKEERVAAYQPLLRYKWGVVVTQPTKNAFVKRNEELWGFFYGYLAYTLLFFVLIGLILHAVIVQKISEDRLKVLNEELRVLSLTDPLTGVWNRRGFDMRAHQYLKMAARHKQNAVILFIDVDNMKWINDNLGHHEGDVVLKEVADILRKCLRDVDIIARLGGDEFGVLIIMSNVGDEKVVIRKLEEQVGRRNAAYQPSRQPLSLSIGAVACDTQEMGDLDKLLSEADKVMYVNKKMKKQS